MNEFLFNILPNGLITFGMIASAIIVLLLLVLDSIPLVGKWAKLGSIVALVFALLFAVQFGYNNKATEVKMEIAVLEAKVAELGEDQGEVTLQVITEYKDRIVYVKKEGDQRVNDIPNYISDYANSVCKLTTGVLRQHNSAAREIPGSSSGPDEKASGPGTN